MAPLLNPPASSQFLPEPAASWTSATGGFWLLDAIGVPQVGFGHRRQHVAAGAIAGQFGQGSAKGRQYRIGTAALLPFWAVLAGV